MKKFILIAVFTLTPFLAQAESAIGKVVSLGCHNVDDTCYVTIDGYNTSSFCNKVGNLRWLANTTFGQRWFAILIAAQMTGATVNLNVDGGSCSGQGFPTFNYGYVNPP